MVYPAAGFGAIAKQAGAFIVEINLDSTPHSSLADATLQGRARSRAFITGDVTTAAGVRGGRDRRSASMHQVASLSQQHPGQPDSHCAFHIITLAIAHMQRVLGSTACFSNACSKIRAEGLAGMGEAGNRHRIEEVRDPSPRSTENNRESKLEIIPSS